MRPILRALCVHLFESMCVCGAFRGICSHGHSVSWGHLSIKTSSNDVHNKLKDDFNCSSDFCFISAHLPEFIRVKIPSTAHFIILDGAETKMHSDRHMLSNIQCCCNLSKALWLISHNFCMYKDRGTSPAWLNSSLCFFHFSRGQVLINATEEDASSLGMKGKLAYMKHESFTGVTSPHCKLTNMHTTYQKIECHLEHICFGQTHLDSFPFVSHTLSLLNYISHTGITQ